MIGYVFEPNAEVVLDSMLPYYVSYQVFQMISTRAHLSIAREWWRMKNATDNANQFIKGPVPGNTTDAPGGITTELLEDRTAQMTLGG